MVIIAYFASRHKEFPIRCVAPGCKGCIVQSADEFLAKYNSDYKCQKTPLWFSFVETADQDALQKYLLANTRKYGLFVSQNGTRIGSVRKTIQDSFLWTELGAFPKEYATLEELCEKHINKLGWIDRL